MKKSPKKTTSKKKVSTKKQVLKETHPLSKYSSEFCEMLIEHMANGFSFESFPAVLYKEKKIMVTRKTLYNWRDQHEDWNEAFDIASSCYMQYQENVMKAADRGERVNAALTIFRVSNKFPDLYKRKDEEKVSEKLDVKIITEYNPKKEK